MKINEKNLCAYAVSSTYAADKEGYLMKKGEVNKGFQKRWFVLKGNLLFYFEKRHDKEPLGVIILEGCTIELDEADAQFSFKIVFHGMGNRSYVLCAESQEGMEQWMKSLACASYDYMKLMVTDLQRQLKETKFDKGADKVTKNTDLFPADTLLPVNSNSNPEDSGFGNVPGQNTSPHPPPRQRHPNHKMSGQSSSSGSPANLLRTRSDLSSASGTSTSYNLPNFRNRISFKDLHTAYGRPILRDRNEWRYNKKAEENSCSLTDTTDLTTNRSQHFLISL